VRFSACGLKKERANDLLDTPSHRVVDCATLFMFIRDKDICASRLRARAHPNHCYVNLVMLNHYVHDPNHCYVNLVMLNHYVHELTPKDQDLALTSGSD
jgi:hypothetical protein